MNQRERFRRVMHFEPVDRVPNVEDGYMDHIPELWHAQGLPADIPFWGEQGDLQYCRNSRELTEYFGLDSHNIIFGVGVSGEEYPRPTQEIVAEDEDTLTVRYSDGSLKRELKYDRGIFQDLDWGVKSRSDWEATKKRYVAGWHNISLTREELTSIRDRDYPAQVGMMGFFDKIRKWMGFEATCLVFFDDPDMAKDMVDFWADYLLEHLRMLLEVFTPEMVELGEDMAYNHGSMLPPRTVEEFLVPAYAKLASFVNSKGVDIITVDSDGFHDELIPVLHEGGVNAWAPFEQVCRQGRDDLLTLGRKYPWLRMFGGMDKMALERNHNAIDEIVALIPPLVERGGYIPTIDHSVPEDAPLEAYKYYLAEKAKRLGGSASAG